MIIYSPILFALALSGHIISGLIGLSFMVLFASIPDIDLRIPFLKHRGFTHTYVFAILIGLVVCGFASTTYNLLVNFNLVHTSTFYEIGVPIGGFLLGNLIVIGHLIGDVITPSGIRPFKKPNYIPNMPIFWDKRYTLNIVYAKNKIANLSFLALGLILTSFAFFTGMYLNIEYI